MLKLTNEDVEKLIYKALWEKGDLRFKLKKAQLAMWSAIKDSKYFKFVIKCSRRLGKTYFLCSFAIHECRRKPYTMVRYAAPTNKALKKFIIPVMRSILEDCPQELCPQFIRGDGYYLFPNGSEIHLSGVNNDNADSLRGTHADLFIIDEAGFVDDLEYVINDVALPQFLDPNGQVVEGRRLIVSGSPARTPAHPFTQVAREAELKGNYAHYDIHQAEYPAHVVQMIIDECGGEESTTWKREYLALDVVDLNYALIPEWSATYAQTPVKDDKFRFYHKYVSLDIGVRDLTVALFAHYDFLKATLYIHDEVVLSGPQMTTERLAEEVRAAEDRNFGLDNNGKPYQIHKRVSDIDLLLLNDLRALHKLYFSPTNKGKLEEMVNEVRIWVNAGRVIVAPHCKQAIGCLAYGVWDKNRRDFDRVPEFGHFDALASLMYMIRNVEQNTNPIPPTYGHDPKDVLFDPAILLVNQKQNMLKKAFATR